MPGNEGKCCDAVVRLLERRTAAAHTDLHLPDKSGGDSQRVDLCVRLGCVRYALEHTRIEPFPDAISTGAFLSRLLEPVEQRLSGALPGPAFYQLLFPQDPRVALGALKLERVRTGLVEWVSAQAPGLYARAAEASASALRSARFVASVDQTPPGLPYSVKLVCRLRSRGSGSSSGRLGSARLVSGDEALEAQRVERLSTALVKKSPKLHHCKTHGDRTVLVLESDDIFLTNSGLVSDALARAAAGHAHLPEEIYLVETHFDPWGIFPMNLAAHASFDSDEPVLHEFESDNLLDLSFDPVRGDPPPGALGPCAACGPSRAPCA